MRWDRSKGITAICGLALMQTFIIVDLIYIPLRLIYPFDALKPYNNYMKYITVGIISSLFFINDWYYKGKYYGYIRNKFQDESFRVLKTILIFIVILLPLILFIVCAVTLKPL